MSAKIDCQYTISQNAAQIAMRVWSTASSISVDPASIATMQDEYNRYSLDFWNAVYNTLTDRQRDNMVFVFGRILSAADFRQFMAHGAMSDARREVEARLRTREQALTEREAKANRALDMMDNAIRAQSNAINEAYASNNRLLDRIEELDAENRALEERYERLREKLAMLLDGAA